MNETTASQTSQTLTNQTLTSEQKENKLNKYLNNCYAEHAGITAIELAKQFCSTCVCANFQFPHNNMLLCILVIYQMMKKSKHILEKL